jgi:hypothetical protein
VAPAASGLASNNLATYLAIGGVLSAISGMLLLSTRVSRFAARTKVFAKF